MKLKRLWVCVTTASAAGATVMLPGGIASASSPLTYDAVAASYGLQSLYANPSIPAGVTLEGSGPVAQSALNTLGSSKGFASLPYPGDVAVGFPSLVNGLTGLPVPPYPFYVASQYGSPNPEPVSFPGFTLSSRSLADQSESSVTAQQANGFLSEAEVVDSAGAVTAEADATFNVLQIGPSLTLSGVRSQSKVVLTPDGRLVKSSSLSVGRFIAPGLTLAVPPTAPAPFGGSALAAPELSLSDGNFLVTLPFAGGTQQYEVPAEAVFDGLAALGVMGTFEKAQTTPSGVVSPTLTFETTLASPPENPLYNGTTAVTYRIGLTSASVLGQGGSDAVTSTVPGSTSTPTAGSAPPDLAGLPSLGGIPAGAALPQLPTADLAGAPAGLNANLSLPNPRPGLAWFYLVLVAVAATGALATRACVRSLGGGA